MTALTRREFCETVARQAAFAGLFSLGEREFLAKPLDLPIGCQTWSVRDLIAKANLERPLFNEPLLGFVVDALWPKQRVIVEVDGYAYHHHRAAFERDRARDQQLIAQSLGQDRGGFHFQRNGVKAAAPGGGM